MVKMKNRKDPEENPEYEDYIDDTHITVYKVSDQHGYEYELYSESRGIEYDSLYESSNYMGDGAKTLQKAIEWAKRTLEEWDQ